MFSRFPISLKHLLRASNWQFRVRHLFLGSLGYLTAVQFPTWHGVSIDQAPPSLLWLYRVVVLETTCNVQPKTHEAVLGLNIVYTEKRLVLLLP